MTTYTVVRDCCTSGNCAVCRDVTPYGKPLRVVHAYDLLEEIADKMLEGWKRYRPVKRETVQADRPMRLNVPPKPDVVGDNTQD